MPRVSSLPFDRPTPVYDENDAAHDDATLSRVKIATAWVGTTIAGVAAVAYASFSQTSASITTLVLIGLLAAYAGYGSFLKHKSSAQFADSLYYMGFLWALFALMATFVIWPGPKLTHDAVLTGFGYALATLFCGMFLRLVMLHVHQAPPDANARRQEVIDQRVEVLVQELNEATTEIMAFRDRVAGHLGGTLDQLVRSLTEAREQIAEQQQAMVKLTSEAFESSLKEVLRRLSAIHIPQETLTAEIGNVVSALGKQGERFDRAAQTLETSLKHAAETVTAFGDSLSGSDSAKQIRAAVHDLSQRIRERTEEFGEMTATLDKSRADLDGQLRDLQALRSAVAMVSTQLSAFETELGEIADAALSADVKTGLVNVQEAIRSSLDASQAIESTMRGVLFFMRESAAQEHPGAKH